MRLITARISELYMQFSGRSVQSQLTLQSLTALLREDLGMGCFSYPLISCVVGQFGIDQFRITFPDFVRVYSYLNRCQSACAANSSPDELLENLVALM